MKFEYKFIRILGTGNDQELQKLNELGEEGWEVLCPASEGLVILKRLKK